MVLLLIVLVGMDAAVHVRFQVSRRPVRVHECEDGIASCWVELAMLPELSSPDRPAWVPTVCPLVVEPKRTRSSVIERICQW